MTTSDGFPAADDWGDTVDAANAEGLFDMDAQAVDASKVGSRVHIEKVGKYHVELVDAKNDFETRTNKGDEKSPCVLVTCEVQASEKDLSPPGSMYWHRIDVGGKGGGPLEDWQLSSSVNFLYGVGLLKKVVVQQDDGMGTIEDVVKFIDPATGTTKIEVHTLAERLKGLQAVFDMKLNKSKDPKYDDKIELVFGRGAFRVDDPMVSGLPWLHKDALAVRKPYPAGESGSGNAVNGASHPPANAATTAPAAQPPAPQQQQSAPAAAPVAPQQPVAEPQAAAVAAPAADLSAWNMDDL